MQSSAHLPVAAFYNAAAGGALLHILIAWHTRKCFAHPIQQKQQNSYTCVSIFILFFHPTYTAPSIHNEDAPPTGHVSPAFVVRALYWLQRPACEAHCKGVFCAGKINFWSLPFEHVNPEWRGSSTRMLKLTQRKILFKSFECVTLLGKGKDLNFVMQIREI